MSSKEFIKKEEKESGLAAIFDGNNNFPMLHEVAPVFYRILYEADDILSLAFGAKIGPKLKRFLKDADYTHPDFTTCLNGFFSDNNKSKVFQELLEIAKFVCERNLSINRIYRLIDRRDIKLPSQIRQKKYPFKTGLRFLSQESRSLGRDSLDVTLVKTSKNNSNWTIPGNFSMYFRNSEKYLEELGNLKVKSDRFKQMRCSAIEKVFLKDVDNFASRFSKDSFLGFYRLSVKDSAEILRNIHGFGSVQGVFNMSSILGLIPSPNIVYCPLLLPLKQVSDMMTKSMSEVVSFLDSYGSFKKPLFDCYWVLIPVINPNQSFYYKNKSYRTALGDLVVFGKHLLREGDVEAILLGDRENTSYFISYWL